MRALLAEARQAIADFNPRNGLKAAAEALRIARHQGDSRSEAEALSIATVCHYQRGDYVSSAATGVDAYATIREHRLAGRSHALHSVALALFSVAEFHRAEEAAARAIRYAHREGDAMQEASTRGMLGYILADSGQYEQALGQFRRARALYKKAGDPVRVKKTSSNSGHALRKCGLDLFSRSPEAARRCWTRALRFYRAALACGRSRVDDAIILGSMGECSLLLGRLDAAEDYLAAAADKTQPKDPAVVVGNLEWRRGELARARGRWDEAERRLLVAIEAADGVDNDDLAVQGRESLALLALDRGDKVEARRGREEARRLKAERQQALAGFRREMRPMWDRFRRAEP